MLSFGIHSNHLIYRRGLVQSELEESENKYRSLVELAPDAIAIQPMDRIVFINPAGVALFGAESAQKIIGKSVMDFVPADSQKIVQQRYHNWCAFLQSCKSQ